ncbi:unnamed protein product [Pieris brassicae]|uniref:Uncharacterized protein n=1 Tax=Pieris brassicae TaxID=7116 RepID=A0A9P0TC32_PIEBR|nr:unnamed protein product [Pieris brassicae]
MNKLQALANYHSYGPASVQNTLIFRENILILTPHSVIVIFLSLPYFIAPCTLQPQLISGIVKSSYSESEPFDSSADRSSFATMWSEVSEPWSLSSDSLSFSSSLSNSSSIILSGNHDSKLNSIILNDGRRTTTNVNEVCGVERREKIYRNLSEYSTAEEIDGTNTRDFSIVFC